MPERYIPGKRLHELRQAAEIESLNIESPILMDGQAVRAGILADLAHHADTHNGILPESYIISRINQIEGTVEAEGELAKAERLENRDEIHRVRTDLNLLRGLRKNELRSHDLQPPI